MRKDSVWHNRTGGYIETTSPTGYDVLINGSSKYLNFNLISGETGYGIRDNAGTMQFKNSGGSWTNFGAGGGGGAVDSVNGQTGVVVLTTADIADSLNKRYVTDANLTTIGNQSGTNTGDQTTIVGITGTKAQFDTAVTDGNFLYTDAIGVSVQAYDADLTTWAGLTPSANAQSLVTAANYAAMRTLLDLEAGTDFYSISTTDTLLATKVGNTGNETIAGVKTFSSDPLIPDEAYGNAWNGVLEPPTKNAVFDEGVLNTLSSFSQITSALGSSILAQTPWVNPAGNTLTLTDAAFYAMAIFIPKDMTLTGVKFIQRAQGSYTADNNNRLGLYSYSAGTLTLVASCANDGNLWKGTADTLITVPFSSTYAASRGVYYVGFLYNNSAQTTAPSLVGFGAPSNFVFSSMDFTNSAKLCATLSAQTDLPASTTMAALSRTNPFFMAVY